MKQTLLVVAAFAAFFFGNVKTSSAQLADGSVAPDWTLTDLNGNSHHLYDYLDNGYTVIIDFSAVWCGPCWSYHTSGALEDLYINHGPAGAPNVSATTTDDVMVFFIEGDGGTLNQLNGIGSGTQGNWVANTPYPIISSQSQTGPYAIGYWPTVYKVCPDRLIEETQGISTAAHYAKVGLCPTKATGDDLAIVDAEGPFGFCDVGSSISPDIKIQNHGTTTLTSATIEVRDGSSVLNTVNWTGSLSTWDLETVNLGSFPVNAGANIKAVITTADTRASNDEYALDSYVAPLVPFDVTLEFYTDNYPGESKWQIKKLSGQTIEQFGPYTGDASGAGGPDALTTKVHQITLPTATQCYKIKMIDTYGDGLTAGSNPEGLYGIRIKVGNTVIVDMAKTSHWNFGNSVTRDAAMKTFDPTDISENSIKEMTISPNPINDVATIKFDNSKNGENTLLVVNALGEVVINKTINSVAGENTIELDMSDLKSGIYIVTLKNGSDAVFSKIIKD